MEQSESMVMGGEEMDGWRLEVGSPQNTAAAPLRGLPPSPLHDGSGIPAGQKKAQSGKIIRG